MKLIFIIYFIKLVKTLPFININYIFLSILLFLFNRKFYLVFNKNCKCINIK